MDRLIAIVGPTASGKSELAATLAFQFGGEVINADSRQFYRGMSIGTAKPSTRQLALAQHHLLDFLEPTDPFSLSNFLGMARSLVGDINARGRLPVVSGGTGQYVWGLLEGWEVPTVPPDPSVRAGLEHELSAGGVGVLAKKLQLLDPEVAARTDLRNPRRVIRALERFMSGTRRTHLPTKSARPPYDSLVIGLRLERGLIHQRVRERIESMISDGWKSEVESLLAAGVAMQAPAMSAIGYREMARHVSGDLTIEQVRHAATVATNRLVRYQNNWFKQDDLRIHWIDALGDTRRDAGKVVETWLDAASQP